MHPPRILGLVVAPLVVLTACTPGTVTTPSPTPTTPMCTPEFGGDAYPCSTAEYDQMKLRDAEYARAEAVYRKFFELEREANDSGATTPTAELMALLDGPLVTLVPKSYEGRAGRDYGEMSITSVRRVASTEPDLGIELALQVCIQRRGGVNDTMDLPGQASPQKVTFSNRDGLRIWAMERGDQPCG